MLPLTTLQNQTQKINTLRATACTDTAFGKVKIYQDGITHIPHQ